MRDILTFCAIIKYVLLMLACPLLDLLVYPNLANSYLNSIDHFSLSTKTDLPSLKNILKDTMSFKESYGIL